MYSDLPMENGCLVTVQSPFTGNPDKNLHAVEAVRRCLQIIKTFCRHILGLKAAMLKTRTGVCCPLTGISISADTESANTTWQET